eukprot:1408439-Rhodomonas_salina.3
MQCPALAYSSVWRYHMAYPSPMRCEVLNYPMVLPASPLNNPKRRFALAAKKVLSADARAMQCPVLTCV